MCSGGAWVEVQFVFLAQQHLRRRKLRLHFFESRRHFFRAGNAPDSQELVWLFEQIQGICQKWTNFERFCATEKRARNGFANVY